MEVLQLLDATLVGICSEQEKQATTKPAKDDAWLNLRDAPALHRAAHKLQLTSFAAHAGVFIGMRSHNIDPSQLDPSLATVMRGFRKFCSEQFNKGLR